MASDSTEFIPEPDDGPLQLRKKMSNWRSKHRRSAHKKLQDSDTSSLSPNLQGASPAEAIWIDTNDALADAITHISEESLVAFDSEFIGEGRYYPQICLVQLATNNRTMLIDSLAENLNLMPLWELLASDSVMTLVHSGREDLNFLVRYTHKTPSNTMDTQILAGFCGFDASRSLKNLLQDVFDVTLDGSPQITDWKQRPLETSQWVYALNDVRYLIPLFTQLKARIKDSIIWQWFLEMQKESEDIGRYISSTPPIPRGAARLQPKSRALAWTLAKWREKHAKAENLPPRMVLPDASLMTLAYQHQQTIESLAKVKDLSRTIVDELGEELLLALKEGLENPVPNKYHNPPQPNEKQAIAAKVLVEEWWCALEARCEETGVAIAHVTPKRDIARLANHAVTQKPLPPQCTQIGPFDDEPFRILTGWRAEFIQGMDILEALPPIATEPS